VCYCREVAAKKTERPIVKERRLDGSDVVRKWRLDVSFFFTEVAAR
jgi:hypothetical protein